MAKSPDAFRTISEVSDWLGTQAHVLRFWESKFKQIKPMKRAGGRRYYRPDDMLLLGGIKKLLHDDGMTIKAVQNILKSEGVDHVSGLSHPIDPDEAEEQPQSPQENIIKFTIDPLPVRRPRPVAPKGEDGAEAEEHDTVQPMLFPELKEWAKSGDDTVAKPAAMSKPAAPKAPDPAVTENLFAEDFLPEEPETPEDEVPVDEAADVAASEEKTAEIADTPPPALPEDPALQSFEPATGPLSKLLALSASDRKAHAARMPAAIANAHEFLKRAG